MKSNLPFTVGSFICDDGPDFGIVVAKVANCMIVQRINPDDPFAEPARPEFFCSYTYEAEALSGPISTEAQKRQVIDGIRRIKTEDAEYWRGFARQGEEIERGQRRGYDLKELRRRVDADINRMFASSEGAQCA